MKPGDKLYCKKCLSDIIIKKDEGGLYEHGHRPWCEDLAKEH